MHYSVCCFKCTILLLLTACSLYYAVTLLGYLTSKVRLLFSLWCPSLIGILNQQNSVKENAGCSCVGDTGGREEYNLDSIIEMIFLELYILKQVLFMSENK